MPGKELADTLMNMLIITWLLLFVSVVAALYLPFVHCYYWQGTWRWLALLPLLLPVGYFVSQLPQMLAATPDHSINGPLAVGLVVASLLLSIVLRYWHNSRKRGHGKDGQ